MALADLHARLGVVGCGGSHALLDLAGHGQEGLFNVAGVLGGGLEEGDAEAVSEFLHSSVSCERILLGYYALSYLCDCVLNNLLIRHIALVADKELVDALSGVAVNLLQPLLHVVEGVHVGDIVDDADAMGTTVIGGGDGSESFLAGGIPLKNDFVNLEHVTSPAE